MIVTELNTNIQTQFLSKIRILFELLKFRLSFLVAFSAGFGFALGMSKDSTWIAFFAVCIGGFLISGSAIIINQIFEKDIDKLMDRTKNRPLPTEKTSVEECVKYCIITGITGLLLLAIFTNLETTLLALMSMLLYGFVYTPLKLVGPIAVWVGAIPGALPPMLGWMAATGKLDEKALAIFALQFVWQFPHFWAIAWVMEEDYKKAGIKLLPSKGGKNFSSAFQIMISAFLLLPLCWLPTYLGITGQLSGYLTMACGVLFLLPTLQLLKDRNKKTALKIMFASFLYLPLIQIIYLIDKL
ncbi:MAG: protoheme IX farnesyltransferase [Bacteroidetes bacterium]|nr:MAG: protoheme IX farnesyltransferase [Bacteroidota bacterium]TAG89496.1 MAG: protoheme IX farnesyltransferase [Bacteroidota bacterium]